jgi:hypothetical protein
MLKMDNADRDTKVEHGIKTVEIVRPATAFVKYLPLQLAWACNVHKIQGLTLDCPTQVDILGEDVCGTSVFSHAASLYVAISRVRNPQNLTIVGAKTLMTTELELGTTMLEKYCNMDKRCKAWV